MQVQSRKTMIQLVAAAEVFALVNSVSQQAAKTLRSLRVDRATQADHCEPEALLLLQLAALA